MPQIPAIPGLDGPISTYRFSRAGRASRTPVGSNVSTHMSMRSLNPGPDRRIHLGAHRANAASSRANTSGSVTLSLRLTSAAIIRKSIAPRANTPATLGSRSRSAIANCTCPAARPRLMFNAAEISATTFACPSIAQQLRSTSSSGARRAYNSPIAAIRRPHAAFSSRADDPKPSITAASSTVARAASSDSNIVTAYLLNWTNSLELAKCVAGQRVYVQLFRALVRRHAADELSERVGIGVDALLQQAVEEHSAGL